MVLILKIFSYFIKTIVLLFLIIAFGCVPKNNIKNSATSTGNSATPAAKIIAPNGATVPNPPLIGTATIYATNATVNFNAPTFDGGTPITSYSVTTYTVTSNGTITNTGLVASGLNSPIIVSGLNSTAGINYKFNVTATNLVGTSAVSDFSNLVLTPQTPQTPSVPNQPTITGVTSGNSQVSVAFNPPTSNGGSTIYSYTATSSPQGISITGTNSPIIVTGLTNGVAYTFTVTATNGTGTSLPSLPSNNIVPATVPSAPTGVTAINSNTVNNQVYVYFNPTAAANNGGANISNYTVTSYPDGKTATNITSPVIISNLTFGTSYTFSVTATNSVGTSSPSYASNAVIPTPILTVPGAPTALYAETSNNQIRVSFAAPLISGGSPITSYTITPNIGSPVNGALSPTIFSGLTNGTSYTFKIKAYNSQGAGPEASVTASPSSAASNAPGAPTGIAANRGNTFATISFNPPASNGNAFISYYTVTAIGGGQTITTTGASSPITINQLTNGTSYVFTVNATNTFGTGPSVGSATLTPGTVPSAPTIGTAQIGNKSASITFTPPTNNGGDTIDTYTVISSPGNISASGTTSPIIVSGLMNGTSYKFTVRAHNSLGSSVDSSPSNAVTPTLPQVTPLAPTIISATPGNGYVTISFSPSVDNGGPPITSYVVNSLPGNNYTIANNDLVTCPTGTTPIVCSIQVFGLNNGTSYAFNVSALNTIGYSPTSLNLSAIPTLPITSPAAPSSVVATVNSGTQVTVTFSPSTFAGGPNTSISSYTVTSTPGSISVTQSATLGNSIAIPGLTQGTSYTFTVTATNSANILSLPSSPSNGVIPATIPGTPASITATPGDGQATILFTAPVSNGGSAINSYAITSNPATKTIAGIASVGTQNNPIVFDGLTNGTAYTFSVSATNSIGTGGAKTSTSITPAALPGQPTGLTLANLSATQVDLNFTAPVFTGGSGIVLTGYIVSIIDITSNITTTTTINNPATTSLTMGSLVTGDTYVFTVKAKNNAGVGLDSAPTSSIVPHTPPIAPNVPTIDSATAGNSLAIVTFAPTNISGAYFRVDAYNTSNLTTVVASATGSQSPIAVTGLTNTNSYRFKVTAINYDGGNSATNSILYPIAPAFITPIIAVGITIPGAPQINSASPGNGQATIYFQAPMSGSTVVTYTATAYLSDGTVTSLTGTSTPVNGTPVPIVVNGLTNGNTYFFKVTGTNLAGVGLASASSNTVTPTAFISVAINPPLPFNGNNKTNFQFNVVPIAGVPVTLRASEVRINGTSGLTSSDGNATAGCTATVSGSGTTHPVISVSGCTGNGPITVSTVPCNVATNPGCADTSPASAAAIITNNLASISLASITPTPTYTNAINGTNNYDLYYPNDYLSRSNIPVYIHIHGGGWMKGSRTDDTTIAQAIAQKGFIVFNIDYRLFTPSFDYNLPINSIPVVSSQYSAGPNDIHAFLNNIITASKLSGLHGDATKVSIGGLSEGAHLALVEATRSDRGASTAIANFNCLIDVYGPSDLTSMLSQSSVTSTTYIADYNLITGVFGNAPLINDTTYSPALHANTFEANKLFVAHEINDNLVPYAQSLELIGKVKTYAPQYVDITTISGLDTNQSIGSPNHIWSDVNQIAPVLASFMYDKCR